jgi:integrase
MASGSLRELPPVKGERRWELIVDAPRSPDQPRRRRTRRVGGGKKQAEAELRRFIDEIHAETPTASAGDLTLAEWAERWLDHCAATGRTPRTVADYRSKLRAHVLPVLGDRPLATLRPADVRALQQSLRRRDQTAGELAPATARQVLGILSKMLTRAVHDELLEQNPCNRVENVSAPRHEIRPPATADVLRLLDHIDSTEPDWALWAQLHARTGARRGEVCGLRWDDIDLEAGELTFRRSVAVIDGEHLEGGTKTGVVRTIPIDEALVDRLRSRWADVTRWAHDCDAQPDRAWWVLPMAGAPDHPRPLPPDSASQAWARIATRCALGSVRLHDLRHWHATQLIAAGVDIVTVAHRLGHSDATTTLRVYAHFVHGRGRIGADAIAGVLGTRES